MRVSGQQGDVASMTESAVMLAHGVDHLVHDVSVSCLRLAAARRHRQPQLRQRRAHADRRRQQVDATDRLSGTAGFVGTGRVVGTCRRLVGTDEKTETPQFDRAVTDVGQEGLGERRRKTGHVQRVQLSTVVQHVRQRVRPVAATLRTRPNVSVPRVNDVGPVDKPNE